MKHEIGNMWSCWDKTDHFIFTGNSFLKRNGALVMGRGMAKEVRDKFPGIDISIGNAIEHHLGTYCLILGSKVGVFQVKYNFTDEASLELIEYAAKKLAREASKSTHKRFDLNYPGIGNGRLLKADIEPLLKPLPDNVHVWSFK